MGGGDCVTFDTDINRPPSGIVRNDYRESLPERNFFDYIYKK
jgi:hypothetical protein